MREDTAEEVTGEYVAEVVKEDRTSAEHDDFFFFQAEDGIRDYKVTGVQTCALPISCRRRMRGGRAASCARHCRCGRNREAQTGQMSDAQACKYLSSLSPRCTPADRKSVV